MLAQVNAEPAATKCAGLGLKAALQGVAEALATVELPIEMENMDLLVSSTTLPLAALHFSR